jgi:isocitrate/isopropylmalate dehydrogenase
LAALEAGVVTSLKLATKTACEHSARWAFAYASRRRRKEVTVFHNANIRKLTDGLFIRCAKAAHGSASDLAGQGVANPLALHISGVRIGPHAWCTRKNPPRRSPGWVFTCA